MRRISYLPYLFLALFFLSVLCVPKGTSEKMRSIAICSLSPCWRGLNFLKENTLLLLTLPFPAQRHSSETLLEIERLTVENQLLKSQIQSVREWLLYEDRIQEQASRYKSLMQNSRSDAVGDAFFKRRSQELAHALDLQIYSLAAKVIYRQPASWSSAFWINLGELDNEKVGKEVVGKNSPVLVGTSIVGVVEHVGKRQSRVRLITDAGLAPSVRAVRGDEQNRYLLEYLNPLVLALDLREELFASKQDWMASMQALHHLKNALGQPLGDFYLAKGELHGTSSPLWRSRSPLLKGRGFNYDFADVEGPARDLRSGEPYGASHQGRPLSLLREGDLLVTTGLDGIFPSGLRVAIVSSVQPLKEGASSYEIQAVSTAGQLDELAHVFVLPPYEHFPPQ
jgi:cell shape-determining protein MreC